MERKKIKEALSQIHLKQKTALNPYPHNDLSRS